MDDYENDLCKLANKINTYVYICETITEFVTPEPILFFDGNLGNSDVVYAYAQSRNYTYFFQVSRNVGDENNGVDYISNQAFLAGGPVNNVEQAYKIYYKYTQGSQYERNLVSRLPYGTLIARHQLKK